MGWQPQTLTREQMEERRLEGARLLRTGKLSQAAIARELGVSRATVSDWNKRLLAGGLRQLRRRVPTGRRPRLSSVQQRSLLRVLKKGARQAGFPAERWTLSRVQQVIEREFGVTYHPKYVGRLLHRLGWSPQIPLPRAVERDEDLVLAFLQHDWARIKKSAAARRRHRRL